MDLTLALGAQRDAHVGPEPATERVLYAANFGGGAHPAFHARAALRRAPTAHPVLDLANGETLGHRFAGEIRDDARILESEQRARMTHRQMPLMEHLQYDFREFEEAERVGDGRTIATDGVGHVLLRELEFGNEALVAARLVHR